MEFTMIKNQEIVVGQPSGYKYFNTSGQKIGHGEELLKKNS
jgi:hypothetical protein